MPEGSFVTKGTRLGYSMPSYHFHMGGVNAFDFGSWRFTAEVWNNEHIDDFPSPRYWLALGSYSGNMVDNHLLSDESGNLPDGFEPRTGDKDKDNAKSWKFADNFVNSVVRFGDLTSAAPWSRYNDSNPTSSMGYTAVYIYSPIDHTTDNVVHLKWGVSYGGKIWMNGNSIFDNTADLANNRYLTHVIDEESPILIDEFDLPISLKLGWNTLIIKTNNGNRENTAWLYSVKIGDANGNRLPEIIFSTRDINLQVARGIPGTAQLSWAHINFHGSFVDTYKLDVATDGSFNNLVSNDVDMGYVNQFTVQGLDDKTNYFFRVKPINTSELGGTTLWQHFDDAALTDGNTVGISPLPNLEPNLSISRVTKKIIRFELSLPQNAWAEIKIFDQKGKSYGTVLTGDVKHGKTIMEWDDSQIKSGIYFVTLKVNQFRKTLKFFK